MRSRPCIPAYASGLRYYDTAPLYGHGLSELRMGGGLRHFADPSVVVSTKVGWRLKPTFGQPADAGLFQNITALARFNDYSYDGVMRSYEESLNRLGVDSVDILLIHDVDRRNQGDALSGGFSARRWRARTKRCSRCASKAWSKRSAAG